MKVGVMLGRVRGSNDWKTIGEPSSDINGLKLKYKELVLNGGVIGIKDKTLIQEVRLLDSTRVLKRKFFGTDDNESGLEAMVQPEANVTTTPVTKKKATRGRPPKED